MQDFCEWKLARLGNFVSSSEQLFFLLCLFCVSCLSTVPGAFPALQTWIFLPFSCAGLTVSVPGLEKALHQYTLEPSERPFDMRAVPLATAPIFEQKAGKGTHPVPWEWAGGRAQSPGAALVSRDKSVHSQDLLVPSLWEKPFQELSVTPLAFFHGLAQSFEPLHLAQTALGFICFFSLLLLSFLFFCCLFGAEVGFIPHNSDLLFLLSIQYFHTKKKMYFSVWGDRLAVVCSRMWGKYREI